METGMILFCLFAIVLLCLFFYCFGHYRAWTFWEEATKGEKLRPETRNKINGRVWPSN